MGKPFWKTPIKDWGSINWIQDKIGKPLSSNLLGKITEQVADSNPITGVLFDLIMDDSEEELPATKFNQDDLRKISQLGKQDQKVLDYEIRMAELENQDAQRATDRELEILQNEDIGWLNKHIMPILSFTVITGVILLLSALIMADQIGDNVFQLLTVTFGQLLSVLAMVYAHYFGRNHKSDQIDKQFNKITNGGFK